MGLLYLPDERRPVGLGIVSDGPEHTGNEVKHDSLIDTMLGEAKHSNSGLAVLPTGILRNALAIVGTVDVHLAAAISAIEQAGQRRGLTPTIRVTLDISPDALHTVEGFLVDDGSMGILEW